MASEGGSAGSNKGEREFDIVVFGATGVTGRYIIEQLHNESKSTTFTWAVAGRSRDKLREALKEVAAWCNVADDFFVLTIPTIVADISDQDSLVAMAKRTKVVLNAVGPYRFYGEQVVKACLEASTDHFDISGEPQYMETMQLKYFEEAKEKGVYIVSACGFDSIPCELVFRHLKNKMGGDVSSIETFVSLHSGPSGFRTNVGTWNSAIHGVAHWNELRGIRRQIREKQLTKPLPSPKYKLEKRGVVFRSPVGSGGWCIPFLGSDKSVVIRSEALRYTIANERPSQIQTYFRLGGLLSVIGLGFIGAIFGLLTRFSFGCWLLESYPHIFSFGFFGKGGPTRQQCLEASFTMWGEARGWADKLEDPTDQHTEPPNKTIRVKFHAPDAAYIFTSRLLVCCGITCFLEKDKMLGSGGVMTPGAAFGNTTLFDKIVKSEGVTLQNIGC